MISTSLVVTLRFSPLPHSLVPRMRGKGLPPMIETLAEIGTSVFITTFD